MASLKLKKNDKSFIAARKKLLDGLNASFDQRFKDKEVGVIQAARLLDFPSWPEDGDATGMLIVWNQSSLVFSFVVFIRVV